MLLMQKLTNPNKIWHGWFLIFLMLISCTPLFFLCVLPVPQNTRYFLSNKPALWESQETNIKKRRWGHEKERHLLLHNQLFSQSFTQNCAFRSNPLHGPFASSPWKCSGITTVTLHMQKQSPGLYGLKPLGKNDLWRGTRTTSYRHGSAENLILRVKHLWNCASLSLMDLSFTFMDAGF